MNFEITDKTVYETTRWIIESEDDTYYVLCQEGDLEDEWIITSDNEDEIHRYSDLGRKLIELCIK
jgi:hypothetical protein